MKRKYSCSTPWAIMGSVLTILLMINACTQTPPSDERDMTSLKGAYDGIFMMGTALNGRHIQGMDEPSMDLVRRHFNTITAENVMKPGPINPRPGEYNFEPADRFVDIGEENDMFVVGHTLVWHSQTPDWFFEDEEGNALGRDAQIERMRNHIEQVAGRYAGRVHGWDVVNEAVVEDGSLRDTHWLANIGEDYIQLAFELAAEYAPDAELYYNDYNLWRPSKRDGVMRLVRDLQANGVRVDGIGMQGHWGLEYPELEHIEASIDSFASLGVQVMITELDVDALPRVGGATADVSATEEAGDDMNPYTEGLPDEVQQQLAERYTEFFNILYDRQDVISRVTFWGVHDGQSWKNNFPVRGRTNYPLLFDREHQEKPAYDAVMNIVRQ